MKPGLSGKVSFLWLRVLQEFCNVGLRWPSQKMAFSEFFYNGKWFNFFLSLSSANQTCSLMTRWIMTVPNRLDEIRTQLIFFPSLFTSSEASFTNDSILLTAIPLASLAGSQNGSELQKNCFLWMKWFFTCLQHPWPLILLREKVHNERLLYFRTKK